jgi:hypothetical protein
LGQGFFYRRKRGEEKIFLGQIFLYREAVSKFFLGTKNFFTGRGGGFKSRLCLKFGGEGGKRRFFWTKDFFT